MGWWRWILPLPPCFTAEKQRAPSKDRRLLDQRLPANPHELLRGRLQYELPLLHRRIDTETDNPISALYRMYEHIMLDQHLEIRNEFEAFWFHANWRVCEISDPKDPDPERYAVLACIPALLCLAFNKRIELGLPREAPPIFTHSQLDHWRSQERKYEKVPAWTEAVPRLDTTLVIPHWDNAKRQFVPLDDFDSDHASHEFAQKNILIWQPHVYFA